MEQEKKIKELFEGAEELIKTALNLEPNFNVETGRIVHTKNKKYYFSVKLNLIS